MSSIVKVDTIQENTSANGITVDGLNIKDSKLVTANSVVTANITADAIDATKIADNAISEEHLDVTSITGHTAETSIADGDTILIHDASASALRKMTKANFVSGIGGANTPSFLAYTNADQANISQNTFTKLNKYGAEVYDTDNKFASSRFTPGVVGKYFIFGTAYAENVDGHRTFLNVFVNGSNYQTSAIAPGSSSNSPQQVSTIVNVTNTSDYIELYLNSTGGNNTAFSSGVEVKFGGFKIIT